MSSGARHVYRVFIRATPDQVWQALIDPEFTRKYFHDTAFTAPPERGQPYRTCMSDGRPAVEGVVEEMDPPHRFVQTWRVLYDTAMSEEPPSRVEWTLTEIGPGLTQLDLVHGDLFRSPLTWANVQHGWVYVLDGLKSVVETGEPLPPPAAPIAGVDDAAGEWHRQLGIQANNSIWELLTKPDRTPEEDEDMVCRAYASMYHWTRAARRGPENAVRGEYMLARVQAALGRGDLALHHAQRCLDGALAAGLADFDLAYAHEARARALEAAGRPAEADDAFALAKAVPVADPEDLAIVEADLAVPLR